MPQVILGAENAKGMQGLQPKAAALIILPWAAPQLFCLLRVLGCTLTRLCVLGAGLLLGLKPPWATWCSVACALQVQCNAFEGFGGSLAVTAGGGRRKVPWGGGDLGTEDVAMVSSADLRCPGP